MTVKKRWKEIDSLRGMAILMVLLYHSILVFPIDLHQIQWCKTLHTFLWTVQMPLFFLVSGFCYSPGGNWRAYLGRKCRRILIPHIVFSLLDIAPRLIPNPLVHERMGLREAVIDFLAYGGSDWFLRTLFMISVLFPVLDLLMRRFRHGKITAVIIAALLYAAKPWVTDFLLLNMASQYLLYYLAGYFLREGSGRLLPYIEKRRNLPAALAGMLLFFAGFLAFGENRALELLCVACSLVFFIGLAGLCRGFAERFLGLCGRWSLQMYLLDAYALVATRALLVLVLKLRDPVLIILGNFIADTGIVLGAAKFILTRAGALRFVCGLPEKE